MGCTYNGEIKLKVGLRQEDKYQYPHNSCKKRLKNKARGQIPASAQFLQKKIKKGAIDKLFLLLVFLKN